MTEIEALLASPSADWCEEIGDRLRRVGIEPILSNELTDCILSASREWREIGRPGHLVVHVAGWETDAPLHHDPLPSEDVNALVR